MIDPRDTIFALSSGRVPAAIAVVRISGPKSRFALETMLGRLPEPRKARLARVRDPQSGEVLDHALALWFPAPASETGEDVAELQLHGGRAVVAAVLAALAKLDGFRPAEPGEFTRRTLENGRLDLTQVEALADLIYAETEAQRRQAFQQVTGLLGNRAESWRRQAIEALALVEAGIDFSDEGDVPGDLVTRALGTARALVADIRLALAGAERGERLREGLAVVIAGPPNAGKSTLLNRLARREAAIVSPQAGTTRDVIEVHLDLAGFPVNLFDTAGIRGESDDAVEREGMRRARAAAHRADLVLWVLDGREVDARALCNAEAEPLSAGTARWVVVNKMDVVDAARKAAMASLFTREADSPHEHDDNRAGHGKIERGIERTRERDHEHAAVASAIAIDEMHAGGHGPAASTPRAVERQEVHYVSAATGAGLDELVTAVAQFAERSFTREPALVTRERQRVTLLAVAQALDDAIHRAKAGAGEELVAEDLRHATTHLGRLTGRVDVEDVLDVIFREFCVGK